MRNRIGIFDSGIGGLTVAHAIGRLLSKEQLVYFGDTLHLPYGDKSKETIISYCEKITHFLLEENVKIVVIACNTASAAGAYDAVKKICAAVGVLCIDVIQPIVQQVLQSSYQKIGIIGTRVTIQSDAYAKNIQAVAAEKKVYSLATPLLVPMIEEGILNHPVSKSILDFYLNQSILKDIDTLVLGCTHYPLLYPEIEKFYDYQLPILDGSHAVALAVQHILSKNNLLATEITGENIFFISEYTATFEKNAAILFQNQVNLRIHKEVTG